LVGVAQRSSESAFTVAVGCAFHGKGQKDPSESLTLNQKANGTLVKCNTLHITNYVVWSATYFLKTRPWRSAPNLARDKSLDPLTLAVGQEGFIYMNPLRGKCIGVCESIKA